MMRTGGLPGTYPDDRRAAAMSIATAAPPSWPVYRRHGPTPRLRPARLRAPLVGGSCPSPGMADTGRVAPPPAVASAAHTPTTPLRWRHTAVHVAKQRSCDPNGRSNGFPMDFQWIFNGCFFSIFFIIILESSMDFLPNGSSNGSCNGTGRPNGF